MANKTGLDRIRATGFESLRGKSVGLVCNQGAITLDHHYAFDIFIEAHLAGHFKLAAIFGPQHGLFGHTQDNMIEWEGGNMEPRSGAKIHSLYGEHRKPTPEMLRGIDVLVVDLRDIGARYYTFIWTLFLCMEACGEIGISVIVLDRPNPIGHNITQGTVLRPEFASFVGLRPLPMRHGKTLGELASHFQLKYHPRVDLTIWEPFGFRRGLDYNENLMAWSMPSPNMPTSATALVYPGMCLLEGTNLSEGRGTTRPFEIFGAPFLDGWALCAELNKRELYGVTFRPYEFQPTFQKHAGQICQGAFIHVTDPDGFDPCQMTYEILRECWRQSQGKMCWNPPPYEYEYEKLPIDILAGNTWLREAVEQDLPGRKVLQRMEAECASFDFELSEWAKVVRARI